MSVGRHDVAAKHMHWLFSAGTAIGLREGQLLGQFVARRDGVAFEALVERHGPMVLGVCRRLLRDPHDVEDAFQATFLVLARKANSLRDLDVLGPWLYGVAYRVAVRSRAVASKRRSRECPGMEVDVAAPERDEAREELRAILDEELRRLPEKYRAAVVLCDLEGQTYEQAAQQLRWTVGALRGRLLRGRERLRERLGRRGLAPPEGAAPLAIPLLGTTVEGAGLPNPPSAGLGAGSLAAAFRPQSLPRTLLDATVEAAVKSLAVEGGTARAALATASALVRGTSASGHAVLLGTTAAIALGIGVAVHGIGLGAGPVNMPPPRAVAAPEPPRRDPAEAPRPASAPAPPPPAETNDPAPREGVAHAAPLTGIKIDGRLDDWPATFTRYPIRNLLRDHPSYDDRELGGVDLADNPDMSAWFQVGYDRDAGVIYLGVTVRDDVLHVGHEHSHDTDAVEVYVDGGHGRRSLPVDPWGDPAYGPEHLPALQYIGVPGRGPAYGDPYGANPSLFAGRMRKREARMAYRRAGDLTTYEWSIKIFERYPASPASLVPGKQIGLDVVVVDRDSPRGLPAWISWGPSPRRFKGFDASGLNELILDP